MAHAVGASAFGQGASATGNGAVALGQGSIADQANTVSVGAAGAERSIVNVADGAIVAGSTDAVTGGQLYDTNQAVATAQNTADSALAGATAAQATATTAQTTAETALADAATAQGTADTALSTAATEIGRAHV